MNLVKAWHVSRKMVFVAFIDYSGALVIPRRFYGQGISNGYAPIHDCVRAEVSYVSKDGKLV